MTVPSGAMFDFDEDVLERLESANKGGKPQDCVDFFDSLDLDTSKSAVKRSSRGWFLLGSALRKANRQREALYCLQNSLAREPNNQWVHAEIADIVAKQDPDLGEMHYRHALLRDKGNRLLARAARFAARTRNAAFYRELCEYSVDRHGKFLDAWVTAASVFRDHDMLGQLSSADAVTSGQVGLATYYALAAAEGTSEDFWNRFYAIAGNAVDAAFEANGRDFFMTDEKSAAAFGDVLSALPGSAVSKALDVGCGFGRVTEMMAERGLPVTAIDRAASAIEATEGRLRLGGKTAELVTADLVEWVAQQSNHSYGLVVDSFTHHAIDPRLLDELFAHYSRIVARGGCLTIAVNEKSPQKDRAWHQYVGIHTIDDVVTRCGDHGLETSVTRFPSGAWIVARS